jgi:hypothetical protein
MMTIGTAMVVLGVMWFAMISSGFRLLCAVVGGIALLSILQALAEHH